MRIRGLMILFVGTFGTAICGAQDLSKERDGAWKLVFMETNGVKLEGDALKKIDLTLILEGDKYTVLSGDKAIDKGTAVFDKSKKPNTIDIKSDLGPNKGKTILAITEMKGELMIVCYNLDGNVRPKEFAGKSGSGFMLAHYKKKL